MKKLTLFFALVFVIFSHLHAQENKIENAFHGTRFVNGQSANLVEKGELQLLIQHRFGDISGGLYQLFGLDQANMRLGFEYGFGDAVNAGIGRSTFLKTYDALVKVRIVQQSDQFPFTAVFSTGSSIPTIRDYFPEQKDNFSDKFSGNAQLHLAKSIGKLGFQFSPGILKTGYILDLNQNLTLFTSGLGGSLRFSKKVAANVEYLLFFSEEIQNDKALSFGVDIDTGGHLFQLILSNNQRMYTQALYTHTNGKWAEGNLFFGFNLIREFDINKPLDF